VLNPSFQHRGSVCGLIVEFADFPHLDFLTMSLSFEPSDARFVAYIDEAGESGLTRVYPNGGAKGSSEWLIIGALVLRLEREPELVPWVRGIREKIRAKQAPALHYRNLNPDRKAIVCTELAALPVRCFVLYSNKKNMEGHKNDRVAAARGASSQEYFYNWCVRLLLERVTAFIEEMRKFHYVNLEHQNISKLSLVNTVECGIRKLLHIWTSCDNRHDPRPPTLRHAKLSGPSSIQS
jgi:Protein of unknown function (DUF3800)